jgi:type II secretory pathway predicted ATPase ExeA
MWNWFKNLFGGNKDPLRFLKKAIRITVGLVLINNPQFTLPLSSGIAVIEALLRDKQPADVVKLAIDRALAELAAKVSDNKLIQVEIRDLANDINIEIAGLPQDEQLKKIGEMVEEFRKVVEAYK